MSLEPGIRHRDAEEKMKVILIVDDEVDVTDTFSMLFELHGFKALTASNGREALNILATDTPDIILSDCMMPYMDGLELSRKVRGRTTTRNIPVILMSAAPEQHNFGSSAHQVFIRKPFRFADLLSEVNRLLKANWSK